MPLVAPQSSGPHSAVSTAVGRPDRRRGHGPAEVQGQHGGGDHADHAERDRGVEQQTALGAEREGGTEHQDVEQAARAGARRHAVLVLQEVAEPDLFRVLQMDVDVVERRREPALVVRRVEDEETQRHHEREAPDAPARQVDARPQTGGPARADRRCLPDLRVLVVVALERRHRVPPWPRPLSPSAERRTVSRARTSSGAGPVAASARHGGSPRDGSDPVAAGPSTTHPRPGVTTTRP